MSKITKLNWRDVELALIATPKSKLALTKSLTSGLTQRKCDSKNIFWGVGDRGPNLKPKDAINKYGLEHLAKLPPHDGNKIMPLPEIGPWIAKFQIENGEIVLLESFALRSENNIPIDGIPPDDRANEEHEIAYDIDGNFLNFSPNGADSEGIVATPDGKFWIADEYGPSLLLVRDNGIVEKRIVPIGAAEKYKNSAIEIIEALPEIAATRKLNRGFEAIAVSMDGKKLFVAFQSPLAHPNRGAHDESKLVRIWALDINTCKFICEYCYELDEPKNFKRDNEIEKIKKNDIKISEMAFSNDGRLLVLERVTQSTHIYSIDIANATPLPAHFISLDYRPSLEQIKPKDLETRGVYPIPKTLVFTSDDNPQVCANLEGMICLEYGALLLVNDNDYGTEGEETQFWLIE